MVVAKGTACGLCGWDLWTRTVGALTWEILLLKGLELSSLRLFPKSESIADRAPLVRGSLPKNLLAPEEINGGDGIEGLLR